MTATLRDMNKLATVPPEEGSGTWDKAARSRAMLKKIAFAALLLQVAGFSALITQTLLFSSGATQAADVQPSPDPVAAECAKAVWPDIPVHCLKRVEARKDIAMTAAQ